jgi:hypothetical protein
MCLYSILSSKETEIILADTRRCITGYKVMAVDDEGDIYSLAALCCEPFKWKVGWNPCMPTSYNTVKTASGDQKSSYYPYLHFLLNQKDAGEAAVQIRINLKKHTKKRTKCECGTPLHFYHCYRLVLVEFTLRVRHIEAIGFQGKNSQFKCAVTQRAYLTKFQYNKANKVTKQMVS